MKPNPTSRVASPRPAPAAGIRTASIVDILDDLRLALRVKTGAERTEPATARLTRIAGYQPSVGDRVLAAHDGDGWYVIAVLHTARPLGLELDDGARAEVCDGGLELRDPHGQLLIRYAEGTAQIVAPRRDLELCAPAGRVVLDAGLDVSIRAARDLSHRAGRSVEIEAAAGEQRLQLDPKRTHVATSRLDVEARQCRVASARAVVIAQSISTTAERLAQNVDRYELHARKLVETARNSYRTVLDLAQAKAGRVKTIVTDVYSLHTRRTVLLSKKDTSIDGERVLLG